VSVRSIIVGQFKKPHGLLGHVAGLIMATRLSNRQRNEWTVGLLHLEPGHRVLEIGSGPGIALEFCAAKVTDGHIVGLDHSAVMVKQAQRRLAEEISAGRAQIRLGSLSDISADGIVYDRIFSLNVVQFLPDRERTFRQIHSLLAPGGIAATTYQPRSKNATREDALAMASQIETAMKVASFAQIEHHELAIDPVPAICVTGRRS
jgi:cyclopropane fatty-acyl-phospholipid synthase-like methyltransferase